MERLRATKPIAVRRLNHAVLWVSYLEPAIDFYQRVLSLEVAAREPAANAAFLRAKESPNHHDLGLFGLEQKIQAVPQVGLYHLAWQVDTIDEIASARETLLECGAFSGESDHGATKSVYGFDPDRNEFEVMWMLPREDWGPFAHAAPVRHLDLSQELERWSGVSTAPPGAA
jgi:catechol-2,3-dioxygenase